MRGGDAKVPRIQVGIADDHSIIRTAMRQLLARQGDMELVAEACDCRGALAMVRSRPVDVLILDLLMPGQGGLYCLAMIKARQPRCKVLVFSTCAERHYAPTVIRLGAHGFLNKQCAPDEVVRAVRVIAGGQRYITDDVAQVLADRLDRPGERAHEVLNGRELQLLLCLAQGRGSRQIAADLCLSPRTVSTYRSLLLSKLGLKTDSDITRYTLSQGLVD